MWPRKILFGGTVNKNNLVLLHLSLIINIGPVSVLKFIKILFDEFINNQKNAALQKVEFDLMQVYNFTFDDFRNRFGFTIKQAELLVAGLGDKTLLDQELSLIEKYKIDVFTFIDDDYPADLKEIYSPPVVIYCMGEKLKNYGKKIAIVGSRRSTYYAQQVIKSLIPGLVKKNYSIVSGGALGVDTIAHKTAVEHNSKTIVVLGSGLLQPYPERNKEFFRKIIKGAGTLVSPFPLLRESDRGTFPARNRIIAGLSLGCLVVQAAKKSGALITARFALDEGRSVFAVPGTIFEPVSEGCHNLIKQGARLVTKTDDILEEFGDINFEQEKKEVNKEIVFSTKQVSTEQVSTEQVSTEQVSAKRVSVKMDPILSCLEKESSIDQLSLKLNLGLPALQEKLFDLQMDGKIKQNLAGYWEIL